MRATDVVLAVGLTAIACIDVNTETARSVPIALVAVVAAGLTLAVRRTWPWLPAGALLMVNLPLAATTPGDFAPQTVLLPLLLSLYFLAAATAGLGAWGAGAVTLGLTWAGHAVTPDGDVLDFWPLVIWGVPWLAGRAVRRISVTAAARVAVLEDERDRAAAEAASAERDRIARELHDVVAHSVSVMVVRAGGQRLRLSDKDPEAAEAFGDIERAGREALTELRAMLDVLRDPALSGDAHEPLPGPDGISDLVARMRSAGQNVQVGEYDVPADLPAGVALAAYRIVQEALTNALRHGSGAVELHVASVDDGLRIRVANTIGADGSGRTPGGGRGLAGMRERVRLLGGSLTAGANGGRWTLDATLPLSAGRHA